MAGRLAGKRCLIVGGTSGIGWAAGLRFLQEGAAHVAVAGLDEPRSHEGVRSLYEAAGRPFLSIGCDARDPKQVDEAFAFAVHVFGGLDVLYHVAGGSGRGHGDGPLHECSEEGWQATLDLNLKSTFLTNRAAVRHFLANKQPGAILNMASVLPLAPSPHHFDTCAYTAAKAGVIAMSRLAAGRYAADGIRVNVLAPGLIDTPMAARAVTDPAIRHFLRTKQPLRGGPGSPEDCADAAVFLCSDEARFITGAVLPVDGGWCVSEGQCRTRDEGS
jgi:NAD(P)-dependent dehydrogenase (short-subunit alcohol dehydrogenase family)